MNQCDMGCLCLQGEDQPLAHRAGPLIFLSSNPDEALPLPMPLFGGLQENDHFDGPSRQCGVARDRAPSLCDTGPRRAACHCRCVHLWGPCRCCLGCTMQWVRGSRHLQAHENYCVVKVPVTLCDCPVIPVVTSCCSAQVYTRMKTVPLTLFRMRVFEKCIGLCRTQHTADAHSSQDTCPAGAFLKNKIYLFTYLSGTAGTQTSTHRGNQLCR